jgi:hypothetical protein
MRDQHDALEDPFEQHPRLASEADATGDEHAQAGVGDRVKQGPGSRARPADGARCRAPSQLSSRAQIWMSISQSRTASMRN